jgi:1,4-dihydroxy-2-naphthoate octaprenyltransferase
MTDRIASSWRVWLLAARPRTLGASIAPVIMGTAMAFKDGGFHAPTAVATLLCAILIQIEANYANDYFDFLKGADTDARLGPTRATASGLVTPVQMRNATLIVLGMALLLGLYLVWRGGWPILAIGVLSVIFAALYTGGPYPLGYLGLGEVFVLIFFGPVAVGGTYYAQTLEWRLLPTIAGLAPGLISCAILAVNNLRDIDEDRRTGKHTLAARFGPVFARWEYAVCMSAGTLVIFILLDLYTSPSLFDSWQEALRIAAGFLAVILPERIQRRVFRETGPALNTCLASTGKLLLILSVLFSLGWLL